MWRNSPHGYGRVSIALHWAIAFLFLCQLPLGYVMTLLEDDPATQFELFQLHKSIGFLILALAFPRLVWVLANPTPRPAGTMTHAEIRAAKLVKIGLLILTVAVPLAGWALVSTSPLGIPSYAFDLVIVPNLPLPTTRSAEHLFSRSHEILAYMAGAVALLHIAAALRHHFIKKDATLLRMLRTGREHP